MDILLFALFSGIALVCIALDVFKSVAYLGVVGGILLIIAGTVVSFDINQITQTVCQPGYNYTSMVCDDRTLDMGTGFNYGIGAMFWLVGVGACVDALVNTKKTSFIKD